MVNRASLDKRPDEVATMFDDVAPKYDVVNDVLSMGQTRRWRKVVVDAMDVRAGQRVLDLAAGTGTSSEPYADAGINVVACDFSLGMLKVGKRRRPDIDFIAGDATNLPFADNTFDASTISFGLRNVNEPKKALAEMLRVTKPGGLVVLSYTVWLGPFGGHEMGLSHYRGGARAAERYTRRHGHRPKNDYGSSLFAVSVADGLEWAESTGALVAAFPRYHPRWAWWLTRVPGLREFAVSNLVLVLAPS